MLINDDGGEKPGVMVPSLNPTLLTVLCFFFVSGVTWMKVRAESSQSSRSSAFSSSCGNARRATSGCRCSACLSFPQDKLAAEGEREKQGEGEREWGRE